MASAAFSHVPALVQVRPRTRGLTPRKLSIAAELSCSRPQVEASQIYWMEAIGKDGGLLSWQSSPYVMWLAARLGGALI